VGTGFLGAISHNGNNQEMLVEIDLDQAVKGAYKRAFCRR
jgi:hypothetical protein